MSSYRTALRKARAGRACWWELADGAAVTLIWTGDEARGRESAVLHVVPASWIDESLAAELIPDLDVFWSWAAVIRLKDPAIVVW